MAEAKDCSQCHCLHCQALSRGEIAQDHQAINRVLVSLNERGRRSFVGVSAHERGRGAVVEAAMIMGRSRTMIRRGNRRSSEPSPNPPTEFVAGRGRKRTKKNSRPDPGTPTSRRR